MYNSPPLIIQVVSAISILSLSLKSAIVTLIGLCVTQISPDASTSGSNKKISPSSGQSSNAVSIVAVAENIESS